MPTLTAYVANLLISGDEVTHLPNESWVRDIIRFNCNGKEILFRQNIDVITRNFSALIGTVCETTTVEVKDVSIEDCKDTIETINAICQLLSFATQSRVKCYGYDFAGGNPIRSREAFTGIANHFRPVFDFNDTFKIKHFVEQAYPNYIRLVKDRELHVVFEYLYQADLTTQLYEIRLLSLFIALENLKSTFARINNISYEKGKFRKSKLINQKIGNPFTFEELLLEIFTSMDMNNNLKEIILLRNEIIHSGLSQKLFAEQFQIYEAIHDLLREYILRLLNYRGTYSPYSSEGMSSANIT